MATNLRKALPLALILAVGAALRLYGLNWDGGQWLHPDERQVYFIVIGLDWPHSLAEALSPDSPLNPHFFAYGSLPFYLLKLVAALLAPLGASFRDPNNLHLIGRPLAALFDLGTVYLTYRLARRLDASRGYRILAAALVSLAVLHVQLAHFYTVDPLLTLFVMLTLNLAADVAQDGGWRRRVALGVAFGLALATKVSAFPLILAIYVACHVQGTRHNDQAPISNTQSKIQNLKSTIVRLLPTLAVAGAIFFLVQPYALIDWRTFLDQTIRETQIARGTLDAPYTLQYAGTLPFLYSMWQTAFWGLGLSLGLVAWASFAALLVRWLQRGLWADTLLLAWAGPYLIITGLLYTRYLRYMLPLTPVLCLLAAWFLENLRKHTLRIVGHRSLDIRYWILDIGRWLLVILSLVYALVFVSIYAVPHSWITASEWIYRNIPAGSTLAVEHWDVALPLPLELDGVSWRNGQYDLRVLPLYDEPDDAAKWEPLAANLADRDYLLISSRRLYGSIARVPDRYPVAARYYDLLFAGDLGFELVGEFTRGPAWLNPRIPPLPGAAPALFRPDESFVVYDHPRALIFRNAERLPADELLRRLGVGR